MFTNRLLIFLILPIIGWCQVVSFTGIVRDSVGSPLKMASVMAVTAREGTVASFGITDQEGRFRLELNADSSYILKASYVGFEPFEAAVNPAEMTSLTIVMKSKGTLLKDIEIIADFPVVVSGDTITYKAEAFTQGNERKLEDVLEDLPGFEVDENGEIKVQGKKVDKVLVEGKEFFDGDTKMATKNIPADAVDKIQLLRNFEDVAPMQGLGDEDRMAVNIQLKDGKKNMVFGDALVAGGFQNRYYGRLNGFYYNPRLNINLISDANNIGKPAFSIMDYFRFSGGFRNRGSGSINLGSEASFLSADERSASHIESRLGALNFNYVPSKKLSLGGFFIGGITNTLQENIDSRTFIRTTGNIQELLQNTNNQQAGTRLAKFKATYSPLSSIFIASETLFKSANVGANLILNSTIDSLQNIIRSPINQLDQSIRQDISVYYSPTDQDVFSLETSAYQELTNQSLDLIASNPLFPGLFYQEMQDLTVLYQHLHTDSRAIKSDFSYYRILNRTNHISFGGGFDYNTQQMNHDLTNNLVIEELRNQQVLTINKSYLSLGYKTKIEDLMLHPSVGWHRFGYSTLLQLENNSILHRWLPALNVEYDVTSALSMELRYQQEVDFFDVTRILPGPVIQNFNAVQVGNPQLNPSLFHSVSLNIRNFSMFNGYNTFGNINYQRKKEDITNQVDFIGQNRILLPWNVNGVNENLSVFGNMTKRFRRWKFDAGIEYNLTTFTNKIEENEVLNQSVIYSGKVGVQTTLFRSLILSIKSNGIINNYSGGNSISTFITLNPETKIDYTFGPFNPELSLEIKLAQKAS